MVETDLKVQKDSYRLKLFNHLTFNVIVSFSIESIPMLAKTQL